MTTKTNNLKVRRVDLLAELEERYEWMTREKDKFEKAKEKAEAALLKYEKDLAAWEARIPDLLEGMVRGTPIDVTHMRRNNYGYSPVDSWVADVRVSLSRAEVAKLIGPEPKEPSTSLDVPSFLHNNYRNSRSYHRDAPSVYQAVYQAIKLLNLSDDEYVNASTYQIALEVL